MNLFMTLGPYMSSMEDEGDPSNYEVLCRSVLIVILANCARKVIRFPM